MRSLIAIEYVSVDGVMENPVWTSPYFNEEVGAFQRDQLFASDGLLLGRVTYQGMAAAWPTVRDTDGFAERINGLPKYVASRSLQPTEWNTRLLRGDLVEAVGELKQQAGQNVLIYGSGEVVNTLMAHQLIDEYHLLVHPLVLGRGKQLFTGGNQVALSLVASQITQTGVVLLTYRPQ
ncbi:dihydrofolate reductase family protein [Spirosoma endophyticum]|uniref:Dihydrofolate reductase n=1 Tax=Spirosoma endophyticum TaxID=662367 RepID=A0A1I2H3F3_9BACT|nr:dihydrofolate reductase family protein [Spirosoma endophyticum]SFF23859.1 Dihydrofolate reductase [Spirosoma endophyticum]